MKLLEFFGIIRENDSSNTGTFVGARLTRDSERAIMRWMRDNGLRKKEPRARFHITVVGDKERSFDWNPATFDPPLEVDPSSYKIEKFDEGSIVLTFSVPELEKRHEQAIEKYGINWKFPTYQPHLTLSYDPTELNNIERLLRPTFPIYIANEYAQPWGFKESDSSTERRRKNRLAEDILMERNVMNAQDANIWAKQMADQMFGQNLNAPHVGADHGDTGTVAAVHNWAQKALRKYLINDVPAPQILSFRTDANVYPYPDRDLLGNAKITYPRDTARFGILSGHTKNRNITAPHWVPDALERGEELFWLDERVLRMDGALGAVRDWFRHLARHAPERLNPGRLNRMSWLQAEQAAFAWHDEMRASELDTEEDEGHREIYMDMGNGVAWWKLTGPTCLDREGSLMGHCVADYAEEVESGHSIILSLRDSKNNPHVTVELGKDIPWAKNSKDKPTPTASLVQVKGKENKPPVEKYWPYVDKLIKKLDTESGGLYVTAEGHQDLRECDIVKLGPMLVRTEPALSDVDCIISMVQYPKDREWSVFDNEEMPFWTAEQQLINRDILPDNEDHFSFSLTDESEAIQYIRWMLLRDGKFEVDTETELDDQFLHDNRDFAITDAVDKVPTRINIRIPDIQYDVLAGDPKEFRYDISHAIASREATT